MDMSRDETIQKYAPMVEWICNYWCAKFPHRAEDLLGVGYLILAETVNSFNPKKANGDPKKSFESYLKSCLHYGLQRHCYSDRLVRPPQGSKWLMDALDKDEDISRFFDIDDEAEADCVVWDKPDYLGEIMSSKYFTPTEKKYLRMRAEGYTYEEIGERYNENKKNVAYRIRNTRERLRKIFNG